MRPDGRGSVTRRRDITRGQLVTFEQMLNHDHEFAPDADKVTADGPSPVMPGPDGKYPIPQPGIKKTREY